ncbi:uncharacterized protein LOC117332853 [Pecten maximus]|uniref:uncharacterized protein LOC117332853 n=1 Tax=Pecten maximus TaxID=6579 RepID=UPI001458370A|nr:uncharacterized protein LOC117332853 [Pecten maximus]
MDDRVGYFTLCVLLAVCLLGAIFSLVFVLSPSVDIKSSNNIFNYSFSASFAIDEIERSGIGTEHTYLKIEWNSVARKMHFQQTEVFSSNHDFDYELSLIMADDKATVSLSHLNESLAFCIEDLSISSWFTAFQHLVTDANWLGGSKSEACRGSIWFTKHRHDIIEICTFDDQFEYIIFQKIRAKVMSWTKTEQQNIRIDSNVLNGPCRNIIPITCNLKNRPKVKRDSGRSPKTCLFVHGAGNLASGNDVKSYMPDYWGEVKSHTTGCASHKFLVYNSRDNGWDKDQIQQHFCNVSSTNRTIKNTVIFSHSMGNLVIAAALHRKKCTFDTNTSQWFSVQGPWTGSVVANTLSDICRKPTFFQKLIRRILRGEGYCKPNEDAEFNVYTTLKTSYVSPTGIRFDDLVDEGRKYVSGVMCGTSSWGQGEDYTDSAALWILQKYSNLGNPNDGMVAFNSCKLQTVVPFKTKSIHAYFKGKFNHADGTCRYGGCPCKWYEHMH